MRRAIIVIPAAGRADGRAEACKQDPGGNGCFIPPLSLTGSLPATHYWCSWLMSQAKWTALKTAFDKNTSRPLTRFYDGLVRSPASVLAELGLKKIVEP